MKIENNKTAWSVAAVLVIVISVVYIYRSSQSQLPAPVYDPILTSLGETAAVETARLMKEEGRIVLITYDGEQDDVTYGNETTRAFRKRLAAYPKISVIGTAVVPHPPVNSDFAHLRLLLAKQCVDAVKNYPMADTFVSFVGLPDFTETELGQLPATRPHFVAVGVVVSPSDAARLISPGIIDIALARRSTPPTDGKAPQTVEEWFDRHFEIISPPR